MLHRSSFVCGRYVTGAPLVVPIVFALSLACAGCGSHTAAARRGKGGGGVPVVTTHAMQKDVPVTVQAIGNIEAYSTVTIQSQVTGQLTGVSFHEGDFVKKGDLLFTIDPRPFRAALAQAQANLTRDEALLAQAEAQVDRDTAQANYSRLTAERNTELSRTGIVSKEVAEQLRAAASATGATVKADNAAVKSARAQLAAQRAAVETAKLELGYTTIRSPIAGRTGNLNVKAGNLVTANVTKMITVQQIDPVYVTFSVPAIHLPAIKRFMAKRRLLVVVRPQDADERPANGALTFVDSLVDATTDTIRLKGTLPNPNHRLWPGQFARVALKLTTLPNAVVVPNEAVQTGQDGQYVFVVKPDSTVEQQPVTTGERVGQDIVIEKGLKAGDLIVTEGQLRLEPGTRIQSSGGHGSGEADGGSGRGKGHPSS